MKFAMMGATFMFSATSAPMVIASDEDSHAEFDYQAPSDTPEATPQKSVQKQGNKRRGAGIKEKATKASFKKKSVDDLRNADRLSMQKQIHLLTERINRLEAGKRPSIIPSSALPDENEPRTGFISLPGTNTIIKLGGYIKIDAIYDANQSTGDYSNIPTLRLKGLDDDALRTGVFHAHAKQTRFSLGSETKTAIGQILAYFEGDFFGASTEGTTGSFSRADNASTNSYNFRIRHAYGSYCFDAGHRIDIGQMWTLFYDPQSAGKTIEFNGPEMTAQIRRPQIRYTYLHQNWKLGMSLESGATEYLDISPDFAGTLNAAGIANLNAGSPNPSYNSSQYRRAQSSFLGGISGDGNQALPDLVVQAIYKKKQAYHVSLGLAIRELKIKKTLSTGPNDPIFSAKKYGYGVALGTRIYVHNKSNIFAQASFGRGIGAYIFALSGYGAAIDASRGLMQTQFCYGFLVGGEHFWCENWRTNIIYGQARANIADFIPKGRVAVKGLDNNKNIATLVNTGYSISNVLHQFYVNLLWAPVEKFELGLEYAYLRRHTINNYVGYGNRFQLAAYYRF